MKIDAALLNSFCLNSVIDPNPLRVNAQTPIRQVIQLMNQTQKGCALIMSSQSDSSALLSIFTERDVVKFLATHHLEEHYEEPIAQVILLPAIVISQVEAMNLSTILEKINQHQLRYLPVIDLQRKVIGLITDERLFHQLGNLNKTNFQPLKVKNPPPDPCLSYLFNPQYLNFEGYESRLFQSLIERRFIDLVQQEFATFSNTLPKFTALIQENSSSNSNIFNSNITLQDNLNLENINLKFYWQLFQKFSDATPQIIYIYHLQQGRNIYVNHQFTTLLGYSPEVVKSAHNTFFVDKVHPDDLPKLALQMERFVTAQEQEVMELEYRLQHANGEWRWLQGWEMIFLRDASGTPQQIIGIAADITVAKETEIALKKSEECYRLLAENSTDLIICHTSKGCCLYVSPACRTLLGYEPEELLGYAAYSKLHKQDLYMIQQAQKAILQGEGMQTLCYRIRHKKGHYVWMETNIHAIDDPQTDDSTAMISTSRDISERKQSEEALKLSQERLQSILNSLQDMVWSAEFETHQLLYLNPIAAHIYGRPLDDFFQHQNFWLEVIHPEDRVRVKENLQQVFNSKLPELEYRIIRPSGEIRWIRDRSWIVYNEAGEPIRQDGLATDITENKRIEETLQLTQQKLEYLLDSNPAVIYSADVFPPYAVKFISQNVTRILGYSSQLFIENSNFWCNHLHPEDVDRVFAQLPKLFETSGHLQIDYRFLIKESSYRWIRNEMRLIRDQNNQPLEIVGYMADITPQKIAEAETYKALAKYQELSQLRSRFITLTSHEFRTPLCTILSSADLLEFYTEKQAIEKQKEHIERIQNAALHLTNLLSDILTFSQANVDQLECYPEPLDLEMFCRQIIKEISLNDQYQHPIHFVIDEQISTPCLDQKLLRYIFTNLLSNAVKYSPAGSPVFIEVFSQNSQNDQQFIHSNPTQPIIIFKIQDQGIGILYEDQSQIFDSFYRGNNLENQPGIGLGLAIVKKAVEAHGGSISFETQLGMGTTFTIALP